MMNECYNKRQLKNHNDKRDLHESNKLTINEEAATHIQRIMYGMERGDTIEMP